VVDPALSVLAAGVARLPLAVRVWLGGALGFVAGSVLRIRRGLVESAMARAGITAPEGVATRMYRDLGHGIFELLWLAAAPREERVRAIGEVTFDDDLRAAIDEASGPVVFFASHTGNWELAAAAAAKLLAARNRQLVVVAKAMSARGVDAFLARLRTRLGLSTLSPKGAFAAAAKHLAAGDVVALPIDQVPDRAEHGVRVSFLDEVAFVDRAPATLAWRSRATILVVAAQREASGHRARLLDTIAPTDDGPASVWIESATIRATKALQSFVVSSPESWLWLHRRWRAPHACRDRRPGLIRSHAQ
jgi:KDO2-lipid IV(A) lauroyltransferase